MRSYLDYLFFFGILSYIVGYIKEYNEKKGFYCASSLIFCSVRYKTILDVAFFALSYMAGYGIFRIYLGRTLREEMRTTALSALRACTLLRVDMSCGNHPLVSRIGLISNCPVEIWAFGKVQWFRTPFQEQVFLHLSVLMLSFLGAFHQTSMERTRNSCWRPRALFSKFLRLSLG